MSLSVDEIYKITAQEMVNNISSDWNESYLEVEREAEDAIGFSGGWIDKTGEFISFKFREFKNRRQLTKGFHELHSITTENGINRWNKAKFTLLPSGEFSIDFKWDQALADEIEQLNNE